ncbi:hypothetical protein CANCADRAFT_4495 [Tortispora caseinolytica NRRL Y-17796]|uniref:3-beta hydroxysteroid dehydrogenase/isomerase domain-containing protein n=1 Tax=Tortispora caseinolytica NRRL Y-17796 TaxID=767744 RepID=A0A1E4T9D1_9ASCO|nr:hypothetical protein CANCADRAFT_4495 [Tortispora caseinolytica NRRL Y-17796]
MTKTLLSGASGFIAAHILQKLLARGDTVVATVRSQSKADFIAGKYENEVKTGQLSFAIVPDISVLGAFDDAVTEDLDVVVHTASPFHHNITDPDKDILLPAINGTKSMLEAVYKYGKNVTRLVITSSFAAIVDPFKPTTPDVVYTEESWSPLTLEQGRKDKNCTYRASKTVAEQTAWQFLKDHPDAKFSITTVNPPFVWGPILNDISVGNLNTSNEVLYKVLTGKLGPESKFPVAFFVDVRDVAMAHVLAADPSNKEIANKRLFVNGGHFNLELVATIMRKLFPNEKRIDPNFGSTDIETVRKNSPSYDNSATTKLLKFDYIPLEKCIKDFVEQVYTLEKS